jgi:multidrug resistance efflux pump
MKLIKKIVVRLILLAIVGGVGYWGWRLFQSMPQRQAQIATTKVRKGDVVVRTFARGELRAVRSATLVAPNLFGTVQVTQMAPLGALSKDKYLIVEFDDSEVNSRIEEKQLELDQIEEQIKKAQADLAIRNNQDQVELLRARYSVRRSELEVRRNELLPAIDQRKNSLNLEESKRRLQQLESDIKSRQQQAKAEMAVLNERRNKGRLEMARERQRLSQVKLLAPMGGLVAVRQNRQGMFMPGMQIPDIREGDQVQPGIPVADVLDLSELEIVAKIGELDRANLREGQDVNIRLDALGEKTFHGKIKTMSGTASANIFSGDPAKKFDVVFSLDMKELLSGLGATPEQVRKVLATAEANRRKPLAVTSASSMMAGGPPAGMMMNRGGGDSPAGAGGGAAPAQMAPMAGAPGAGGAPAAMGGAPAAMAGPGGPGAESGGRRGGFGGPGGMMSQLSEEDGKKFRAAMQKALGGKSMRDLEPEERAKVMREAAKAVPAAAKLMQAAGGPAGRGPGAPAASGGMMGGGVAQFSESDIANAKLPAAMEAESQLDVLLRPGLLADVEIILEKIPNAINIPNQAVFEKDGKQIVYVRGPKGWEERVIRPMKRSESVMVIASGVQPGDVIAMSDPFAKPGDKKKDKPASASPASGLPGGGRS